MNEIRQYLTLRLLGDQMLTLKEEWDYHHVSGKYSGAGFHLLGTRFLRSLAVDWNGVSKVYSFYESLAYLKRSLYNCFQEQSYDQL